jgi:hypothetical protein
MAAGQADATTRAYRSDFGHFTRWCADHQRNPLPAAPDTVVLYITDLSDHAKTSTILRRITAISKAPQAAGHDTPTQHVAEGYDARHSPNERRRSIEEDRHLT